MDGTESRNASTLADIRRLGTWLPDVAAFAAGLAMAWHWQWKAGDLVWSLWLSSLLVGYSIIVWRIFGPAIRAIPGPAEGLGARLAGAALLSAGGLFLLAFFTVHFGMFHYVHSMFLSHFFPELGALGKPLSGWPLYRQVFVHFWPFVPLAAIAERKGYRSDGKGALGGGFGVAYANVIRMHLLIFFFFFAHVAHLENFRVYAVVYAVYFFPWSLIRRRSAALAPA